MDFTGVQTEILVELCSLEGLSNKQLAISLNKEPGNISGPLSYLEEKMIILLGPQRYSQKGLKHKEAPYHIILHPDQPKQDLENFDNIIKKIVEMNAPNLGIKLMESEYAKLLNKEFGFITLINIWMKYIHDHDSRKTVSKYILGSPISINEINKCVEMIKEGAEVVDSMIVLKLADNPIKLLESLDLIESIKFYRTNIDNTYNYLFRELHENYFSESIKKFVDLDISLSPFTSYPVNDPIRLLFERPFERLYDDVYLIEASDYEHFIQRAYIVYSNFVEILYHGLRYLISQKIDLLSYKITDLEMQKDNTDSDFWDQENDEKMTSLDEKMISLYNIEKSLDNILKTSIFYWNIASGRIDSLYQKLNLKKIYTNNQLGKYRIHTDDKILKIIDLETDNNILGSSDSTEIMGAYFLLDVILDNCRNPFTYLRPCNMFYEAGFKVEIKTYEKLLEDLKHLYSESNANTDSI